MIDVVYPFWMAHWLVSTVHYFQKRIINPFNVVASEVWIYIIR